ncbi:SDR family oxidoreductase [Paenibacillus agilis]|uniref:NAD-dependent epimerase/dehydratase family protein n=1 Tax=Paenibacillus agilis TaxID=3020863 RepID=A0A559IXR4_9BACL|nr:NmrA family NAD(P)-binding protein [Paenibacillus agilis]TVX92396.1 NAD-dependent epimerase/dehydratase family protein [Paenibacillus agilis]
MTILVTGATGTVGRHVVDQLLRRGQKVRALTRNPQAILPEGVEIAVGDLSDPSTLDAAFEGVTAIHLMTTGAEYVPLQTGLEIVALAKKAGVRKVTVLWTGEKGSVEQAVEASDLEWTQLQPVEFMSNVRKWTDSISKEGIVRDLFSGSLNASVHEADIGRVAAVALTEDGHAGKEYILTGPEVLSVTDQVRIIGEAIGQTLTLLETTEEEEREQMRKMGVREDVINFVISWHLNPPPIAYTVLPTIEEVLGQPAYTFKQWAEENASYFIKS